VDGGVERRFEGRTNSGGGRVGGSGVSAGGVDGFDLVGRDAFQQRLTWITGSPVPETLSPRHATVFSLAAQWSLAWRPKTEELN
jgi:hypothetical protein